MNYNPFFGSNPVVYALGWTLLHAIWQGFALVLPTAVALYLLRDRSSALRYQIGVLTLCAQLLTSAATFVWYYTPTGSPVPVLARTTALQTLSVRWYNSTQSLPWHQQVQQFLESHLSQFVVVYLIGVALFGLRLAGGWFYLQHLSRTATQPVANRLAELMQQLRSVLAIRSVVQVRESARIAVPMVVGMLKPVLLLPIGLATHLTINEVEAVLAHELAHIKRHDYAVNLLQSVMEVLYFFHPALWWLSARVREEREHCCDDLAVQACGGNGRVLAQALARVEELRLTQASQPPALAMALTTNRQLLLHRVRRVLGVPTRPIVSNGSLAGLTLATLLLISASVYAVQQQQPKPKQTKQPQSTRRHRIDSSSEYGMVGDKKVSYVVWKGQKLPAARVAKLQRQLERVMAGQLNLDDVNQPDRDILLTIFEKNNAFDAGMSDLATGLAHIDYNNIVASSLSTVPLSPDGTVEGLANVNYDKLIHDAFANIPGGHPLSDSLSRIRAYHQRQMDSLSQLLAQRSQQAQALRLQMEKLRFPVEESERSRETLEWRKQRLLEQRQKILEKRQQLLNGATNGKAKPDPDAIEKQLELLEPEIKKQELAVEQLNKQLEEAEAKMETTRQPMEKLEREAEKLDEQVNQLSEEIGKHGDEVSELVPPEPMGEVYEIDVRHARKIRPPRPPRPAKEPNIVVAPMAPVRADVRVNFTPARPAAPRPAPKPIPTPKPAPTPDK